LTPRIRTTSAAIAAALAAAAPASAQDTPTIATPEPTEQAQPEGTPTEPDPILRENRDQADRPVPFERPPEGQPDPAADLPFPILLFELVNPTVFRSEGSFDDSDNGYSVVATQAELRALYVVSPGLTFSGSISAEFRDYEFATNNPILPGDPNSSEPFDTVQTYEIGLTTIIRQSRELTYIVGGSLSSSYEPGADFDESIGGQLLGGVTYALSEDLTLGFGANIIFDLDDRPNAIPLPFVEWRFAEGWELASGARGVEVTYERSEDLTLGIGARFLGREFRLDNEGTLPGGIAEDNAVAIAGFFEWDITRSLTLELAAGAEVFRRLELRDANDVRVFEDDTDTAFLAAARLTFRF
jgi:hypothetical protein